MAVVPELAPGLGLGAGSRRPGPCGGSGPSGRHLLAALRLSSASYLPGRVGPRAAWRRANGIERRQGRRAAPTEGWPVSRRWLSRASLPGKRGALDAVPLPEETRGRLAPRSNNAWRASVQTDFMAAATQPRLQPKPCSPPLASARLPLRCVMLTLLWRQPAGGSPPCQGLGSGLLDPDGREDLCGTAIGDRRRLRSPRNANRSMPHAPR